jgi:hypothetical protein
MEKLGQVGFSEDCLQVLDFAVALGKIEWSQENPGSATNPFRKSFLCRAFRDFFGPLVPVRVPSF